MLGSIELRFVYFSILTLPSSRYFSYARSLSFPLRDSQLLRVSDAALPLFCRIKDISDLFFEESPHFFD